MIKIQSTHTYSNIISLENILKAWEEFIAGKRHRKDVQIFEQNLMSNIIRLHNDLATKTYRHSQYIHFNISDPKPRSIHKASVRDRLLHHAIYRILYPFFYKTFIADSFSCRIKKGTHRALNRFRDFTYIVSHNHTRTCWILKCDIKKFFASIDHKVLLDNLNSYIPDKQIIWLLKEIIESFSTKLSTGLPLGNLTSQLFVSIYMNEFDQFVKHQLKDRYYIRYADDFVLLSDNRMWLEAQLPGIESFLKNVLLLELHPNKVFIKTLASGVDFLGWVHFADHRVPRTATVRRIIRRLLESPSIEARQSYLGLLKYGNATQLRDILIPPLDLPLGPPAGGGGENQGSISRILSWARASAVSSDGAEILNVSAPFCLLAPRIAWISRRREASP